MTSLRSALASLTAAILFAASPTLFAAPVTVVDISHATVADVEALKALPDDVWWLEMGKQLVLVGADAAQVVRMPSASVVAAHDDIDPGTLLLRARGCSEHATPYGRVLAQGGRWELRTVDAGDRAAVSREDPHAWHAVTPDSTLASLYRFDPHKRGAAPSDPSVQAVVDRVDSARWFSDVEMLASWDRSSYATTSLADARDWIAGEFSALGLATSTPAFTMAQPGGGTITRNNVLGVWTGSAEPDRWLIVGAHYDSRNASATSTLGTPGAEDNASGCAGVIELARVLLPSQPRRSILFMCYAGEEQGLIGSRAHAQALVDSGDAARVDLVVIMDMIGYSADADLEVLFESSAAHTAALQRFGAAAATYVPALGVVTSTMPFGSDHVPYLDIGLHTVLSIENDWDVYPHYHESTDTPENLGPHALAMGGAILKTNAAVIADAAGLLSAPFADGFEDSL